MLDYLTLWKSCKIRPEVLPEEDKVIRKLLANKKTYQEVEKDTNVPWYFIAILHYLESNCDFKSHLFNGDPLTSRTTHVPKGYPKEGKPPFTWQFSAIDALTLTGLTKRKYDISNMLASFEIYNGLGYRKYDINSPYLWSGSFHYTSGKYVKDGRFDKDAVSKQIGAAVILKEMVSQNIVEV